MKRGFTLIEMLVVVSIILILGAIAMPHFLNALLQAKVARAQADLNTLGNALEAYRTDFPDYPKTIFADLGSVEIELGIFASLPSLTTPIQYLTTLPKDPFVSTNYQYFSTVVNEKHDLAFHRIYGEWVVLSVGPDKDINLNSMTGRLVHYTPTNGSLSKGDIIRSQIESRRERR